ncbi:MAG: RHS repeat-associated core domain-containing protein, partial [Planctomycetes bacterium]|nr:RHS repeat-associated core domain-containing protein [Planctomycetota bacterium]
NGSVTTYVYDNQGRVTRKIVAHDSVGTTGSILTAYSIPGGIPAVAAVTDMTYLEGTDLIKEQYVNGEKTEYLYDGMQRVIETKVTARDGVVLSSKATYLTNLLFSTEDPYGRKKFHAYRASDSELVRTVQATIPNPTSPPTDNATVLAMTRAGTPSSPSPNEEYLITDSEIDVAGQMFATIDPRGVVHATEFDSRGRNIKSVEAATDLGSYSAGDFTPTIDLGALAGIAALTETDYDVQSNVLEVRSPRFFDSGDSEGYNKANTVMTYTRRNMLKDRTVAAGDSGGVDATESFTYNDDGTENVHTDFRSNTWTTLWQTCCKRPIAKVQPATDVDSDTGTGATQALNVTFYTFSGDVAHTGTLMDVTNFTPNCCGAATNLLDTETVNETTIRYDARHRPIAKTAWLVPAYNDGGTGAIDPNAVPIVGGPETNDPDLVVSTVKQGLTTRWLYDEDLTDGNGLDDSTGVSVDKLDGSGSYNVKITGLLSELSSDGIDPHTDANFSAVVTINPDEDIQVVIIDGVGRTVLTGIQESYKTSGTINTPITWQTTKHDAVVSITVGDVLETASVDAINHTVKLRTDGAGREVESEDALTKITASTYDANSNRLSVRDPNNTGLDCVYDERNRDVSCEDTQNDTMARVYDKNNNVITLTDAKTNDTTIVYDARDRKKSSTDRVSSLTQWRYDDNNNLTSLEDGQNQVTAYVFDARNLNTQITWPDHVGGQTVGQINYGITECTYDAAGRKYRCTDHLGDTKTHNYDLASRLTSKDYRTLANSPSGTIADTDSFTYDDASRMLTGVSGRYSNTVTFTFDDAGRKAGEQLSVMGHSYSTTAQYDAANRRTKLTYPDGSFVEESYTVRDQLETLEYTNIPSGGATTSLDVDARTYDDGMRLDTSTYANGVVSSHAHRNDNLTSSISRTGLSGANVTYGYDSNKNKTKETISGAMAGFGFNTSSPATYDDEDRLTAWNRDDTNKNQAWTLSLIGNWNAFNDSALGNETRTHGAAHELTAISGGSNAGSLTLDAKGNTLTTPTHGGITFTWDFDNRLKRANNGANHDFTYDVIGRRVTKTTGGNSFVYISDGMQVVAEYKHDTVPVRLRKYLYASYIDERVVLVDLTAVGASGAGTEELFYYTANNLYSTLAMTNAGGGVVECYAYDAYGDIVYTDATGAPLIVQASTIGNGYTYTGRELDAETGIYQYRARYYDAGLGRFVGRDPIAYDDGMNLYGYVNGMPLDMLDPSGLRREEKLTPALRKTLYDNAFKIVQGRVTSGQMSDLEGKIRMDIVWFAMNSKFGFSKGGWRNPEYWTDGPKHDEKYRFRRDRSPTQGMIDAWLRKYTTGCKQAAQMIQLRGYIQEAIRRDEAAGNTLRRDIFDKFARGKTSGEVYDHFFEKINGNYFSASEYVPGDRAWMKNPCWAKATTAEQDANPGEEGSNVTAVGDGLFVPVGGTVVYDKEGLQRHIYKTFDTIPSGTKLKKLQFRRRYVPRFP